MQKSRKEAPPSSSTSHHLIFFFLGQGVRDLHDPKPFPAVDSIDPSDWGRIPSWFIHPQPRRLQLNESAAVSDLSRPRIFPSSSSPSCLNFSFHLGVYISISLRYAIFFSTYFRANHSIWRASVRVRR